MGRDGLINNLNVWQGPSGGMGAISILAPPKLALAQTKVCRYGSDGRVV